MKPLKSRIIPLLALLFAAAANAAPVQYQFIPLDNDYYESAWEGDQSILRDSDQWIYPSYLPAPHVSAVFSYDSSTPATSTNNVTQIGVYSYYTSSITNLVGSVSGKSFSASSGDTAAFAELPSYSATNTLTLDYFGVDASTESPAHNNFHGFIEGDFTLVGAALLRESPFGSQLLTDFPPYAGLQLHFQNSTGEHRFVSFTGNVTAVPLPSSLLLFISGFSGLVFNACRKFKR